MNLIFKNKIKSHLNSVNKLTVKIKKSSMKTAPKGRTPAIITLLQ